MKNKIKGVFLTLLMLFATLYPSGQAYANGLTLNKMSSIQKQAISNELVNNKDYISMMKNCSFIPILHSLRISISNEEQIKDLNIKIDKLKSQNKFDQDEYAKMLGFNGSDQIIEIYKSANNDFKKIVQQIPEIKSINESDIRDIYELTFKNNAFVENLLNEYKKQNNVWLINCLWNWATNVGIVFTVENYPEICSFMWCGLLTLSTLCLAAPLSLSMIPNLLVSVGVCGKAAFNGVDLSGQRYKNANNYLDACMINGYNNNPGSTAASIIKAASGVINGANSAIDIYDTQNNMERGEFKQD